MDKSIEAGGTVEYIGKVYVTKWALSQGIMEFDGGNLYRNEANTETYFSSGLVFVGQKDWFMNLKDAQQRVSEMKQKKLKTLREQARKLEQTLHESAKVTPWKA
jgi:hypothetical protein